MLRKMNPCVVLCVSLSCGVVLSDWDQFGMGSATMRKPDFEIGKTPNKSSTIVVSIGGEIGNGKKTKLQPRQRSLNLRKRMFQAGPPVGE